MLAGPPTQAGQAVGFRLVDWPLPVVKERAEVKGQRASVQPFSYPAWALGPVALPNRSPPLAMVLPCPQAVLHVIDQVLLPTDS